MKKLFIMIAIVSLIFAGTAMAKDDNGQHRGHHKDTVLTDETNLSGAVDFTYLEVDEFELEDASGVEECSIEAGYSREMNESMSRERSFDYVGNFNYKSGGYALGGQAQLPVQIAYFDEDMTILGQGGIQIQAAMVSGDAEFDAEQGFTNTMVFEGLTMEQTAYQATVITGGPETISESVEIHCAEAEYMERNMAEEGYFNASHSREWSEFEVEIEDLRYINGGLNFDYSNIDQSIGRD